MRYLAVCLGIGLLAYLATGITQVQPGEKAVVRRFGQVAGISEPGLRLGWPAGIDRVDRIAVDRVRRVLVGFNPETEDDDESGAGQLLTGDQNLVDVQVAIDYSVRDFEVARFALYQDRVERILTRAGQAALAEWIAGRTIDEVLLRGKQQLPGLLAGRIQERIEPYQTGIVLQSASITHLYPPTPVRMAFDEVTRAQTAIQTREYEATQEAARKLRETAADVLRGRKLAEAYAKEQVLLAQAEAEQFEKRLAQYRLFRGENPNYLETIWYDEIGKLFTRLREGGRLELLDHRLAGDSLDITIAPTLPGKK